MSNTSESPTQGKGRPTPKRRDQVSRRRTPVTAPKTRREAYRQSRAQAKERRADMRRAIVAGDESKLGPRDAGPVRRFVRDLVDARRGAGGLFLPGAVVVFLASLVPVAPVRSGAYAVWVVMVVAIIVDTGLLIWRIRREVAVRFPGESSRGLASYAAMRSLQLRRLRLPPPRVPRGAKV